MAVVIGQAFGNFQVVRLLGEGGFGEVYEAENPFLQRRAAVKVLHAGMGHDPELVRRFLNEARAASAIRHPNIVDVFDAGVTSDGEPYIMMEFLEGDSLQKIVAQQGRMELARVQEIALQAGSALAAAHLAGIVHRDLKPENLFLVTDAHARLGLRVKVLDFGIAKVKRREDSTVKTQAGLLMGSPAYMSPEQCRDSSDVDQRTDIYSLAVIVYEMLTGAPPFVATSAAEMMVMQLTAAPPSLRELMPDLPEHVDRAVARALAKDREARWGSVDGFVAALQGAAGEVASASGGDEDGEGPTVPLLAPAGASEEALPLATGPLSSRFGMTPLPLPLGGATATTLSRATGETVGGDEAEGVNRRGARRSWLFGAAVVTAGAALLALYWGLRGSLSLPGRIPPVKAPVASPHVPAPTVHVRVQSSPPGAIVLDASRGSVLGVTPLDSTYAASGRPLALILRRDGYVEKAVTIELDGNSSTAVDLERVPVGAPPTTPEPGRPAGQGELAGSMPRKPSGVRKPVRPARSSDRSEEEEWRVH
ncbi:MAG: serine/threonine-protein kinase [Polyangia bacterium]